MEVKFVVEKTDEGYEMIYKTDRYIYRELFTEERIKKLLPDVTIKSSSLGKFIEKYIVSGIKSIEEKDDSLVVTAEFAFIDDISLSFNLKREPIKDHSIHQLEKRVKELSGEVCRLNDLVSDLTATSFMVVNFARINETDLFAHMLKNMPDFVVFNSGLGNASIRETIDAYAAFIGIRLNHVYSCKWIADTLSDTQQKFICAVWQCILDDYEGYLPYSVLSNGPCGFGGSGIPSMFCRKHHLGSQDRCQGVGYHVVLKTSDLGPIKLTRAVSYLNEDGSYRIKNKFGINLICFKMGIYDVLFEYEVVDEDGVETN